MVESIKKLQRRIQLNTLEIQVRLSRFQLSSKRNVKVNLQMIGPQIRTEKYLIDMIIGKDEGSGRTEPQSELRLAITLCSHSTDCLYLHFIRICPATRRI